MHVIALDQDASYTPLFGGLSTVLFEGELEVRQSPYVLAKIERTGLPTASFDAISCVSVLEHVHDAELQLTVKEFKRKVVCSSHLTQGSLLSQRMQRRAQSS